MIDVALDLVGRGHRERVIAVSRRGLLPQAHRTAPQTGRTFLERDELREVHTAMGLLRIVRSAVARAAEAGVDWRSVIGELRPVTPELWTRMGPKEQARFLRTR